MSLLAARDELAALVHGLTACVGLRNRRWSAACVPGTLGLVNWRSGSTIAVLGAAACLGPGRDELQLDELQLDELQLDELQLDELQRDALRYFWEGAEPRSGAARERIHVGESRGDAGVVTVGGTGFGLMAILVGVERGWLPRAEAVERLRSIVGFLERADRFHGAWPHWLSGETGRVVPFSRLDDGADLVETAFLAQGLLCVRQYFVGSSTPDEVRLSAACDRLWRGIEWSFFRGADRDNVLYWHWSAEHGWAMQHAIRGYNECLLVYVLAASSPDHAIDAEVYHEGWARRGAIVAEPPAHLRLVHQASDDRGGPLFWAHYSFLGLDPRNLRDRYADYWQHNREHVGLNLHHCVTNPHGYAGYGPDCWGLTASYSPAGYAAHAPGHDLGVIAPTAALSSFPYAPAAAMAALEAFAGRYRDRLWGPYGPYDAFAPAQGWFPSRYLAIDQGPIVVMVENHRSGLLWRLFMSSPEIARGLARLGFSSW